MSGFLLLSRGVKAEMLSKHKHRNQRHNMQVYENQMQPQALWLAEKGS